MTDMQQQVDHLKHQIDQGAKESKQYLDQLKKKVDEFDTKYHLSETASKYLKKGMDTAHQSVEKLQDAGNQMVQNAKEAPNKSMEMAHGALENMRESMESIKTTAQEYDRKFLGDNVSDSLESIVNATRQRSMDAIEMAAEQLIRLRDTAKETAQEATHGAQVMVGEAARLGEKADQRLGITSRVAGAVGGVAETVKNLDKRMHVTETAVKIDNKITGGLTTNLVHKGVEMVQESIEYVTETLQHAKIAAGKSSSMQMVEEHVTTAGESATSTAESIGESVTETKDQAMAMAGQAQQQVMDTAASLKESIGGGGESGSGSMQESMQHAKEKGSEMMGAAKEKGLDATQSAKETGQSAKQKGSEGIEAAKQKGAEGMEAAKQKGSEMKEKMRGDSPSDATKQAAKTANDTAGQAHAKMENVQMRQHM